MLQSIDYTLVIVIVLVMTNAMVIIVWPTTQISSTLVFR